MPVIYLPYYITYGPRLTPMPPPPHPPRTAWCSTYLGAIPQFPDPICSSGGELVVVGCYEFLSTGACHTNLGDTVPACVVSPVGGS